MADKWYKDGLRFTCTQCGNCCTGASGFVWISDEEIAVLAKRFGLDDASFRRKYTRTLKKGISLREKANNDCVFWATNKGCTVYHDRPRQCRTWPFWQPLLHTPGDWQVAAEECPGMDKGRLHDASTIATIAADDGLV